MDYTLLIEQTKSFIDNEVPLYTVLSNVSAVLNQIDDINWCGFYLVNGNDLFLGPFQGEPACTKIPRGKGVCGTAFLNKETTIVDDVNKFAGHIACSSESKSEIVVPIIKEKEVVGVIDIDSPIYNRFHHDEAKMLEQIALLLSSLNF